jgi:exopolysaccharide production protein ExoY
LEPSGKHRRLGVLSYQVFGTADAGRAYAAVRNSSECAGKGVRPLGAVAKRGLDVSVACLVIILLAPLMLALAGLVRGIIGGPVIFRQKRVGLGGRLFTCYKFRTMPLDAEQILRRHLAADPAAAQEWNQRRKLRNDPRVGSFARAMRRSSLDELPQLINVLCGDMSLVGPRPVVPEEIERYGRHAEACFSTRPGLTGLWQVSGRNRVSYTARIARDRYYVRHWSFWLDIVVLIRTIPAVASFDQAS